MSPECSRQPVTLTIDALKDWKAADGTVSYIAPSAETQQRGGDLRGAGERGLPGRAGEDRHDREPEDRLRHQETMRSWCRTSALLPNGAGHAVQVPGADGAAKEVPVVVGLSDGTNTEIVSGLSAGQAIIATPGQASTT